MTHRTFLATARMLACFLLALPLAALAQPVDAAQTGHLVLIFKSSPAEFSSIKLNGQSFGSLAVSDKYPSVWPIPYGSHVIEFEASEALPKQVEVNITPGQTAVVILSIKTAQPSSTKEGPEKVISARLAMLNLPEPDKTVKIYAYLEPGLSALSGELYKGSLRDVKKTKIELPAARLVPLGEGETAVDVDAKNVLQSFPASPGVFVYIICRDSKGELKSYPLTFFTKKAP
jgi:hypothetical protein